MGPGHTTSLRRGSPEGARRLPFRHDINALRAAAVCLVLAYHFRAPGFTGGFVGVDVFFVISGFLMTSIIQGRLATSTFKFLQFYADRARRILPALFTVAILVQVIALLCVDPLLMGKIGAETLGAVTMISNIYYMLQSGYFATTPVQNWMLHTWSLSVEWQFYAIYPVIYVGVAKIFGASWSRPILLLMSVFSFGCMLAFTALHKDALHIVAFYLLPCRAWELFIGGAVALTATPGNRVLRTILGLSGCVGILSSAMLFDVYTIWPGPLTAVPVVSTAMVLVTGPWSNIMLRSPVPQWIGKWSYSIYLYHWPVLAALTYFTVIEGKSLIFVGVALSVAAGAISYFFIETYGTRWLIQQRVGLWAGLAAVGAVALVSGLSDLSHGFSRWKLSTTYARERAQKILQARDSWRYPRFCAAYARDPSGMETCRMGGQGKVLALIIGDSYAQELAARYERMGRAPSDPQIIFATRAGCAPIPQTRLRGSTSDCSRAINQELQIAAKAPRLVVVASWEQTFAWHAGARARGRICFKTRHFCTAPVNEDEYKRVAEVAVDRLGRDLAQVALGGTKVYVIDPLPTPEGASPDELMPQLMWGTLPTNLRSPYQKHLDKSAYARDLLSRLERFPGVNVVDVSRYLCTNGCPIMERGAPVHTDATHYTPGAVTSDWGVFDRLVGALVA